MERLIILWSFLIVFPHDEVCGKCSNTGPDAIKVCSNSSTHFKTSAAELTISPSELLDVCKCIIHPERRGSYLELSGMDDWPPPGDGVNITITHGNKVVPRAKVGIRPLTSDLVFLLQTGRQNEDNMYCLRFESLPRIVVAVNCTAAFRQQPQDGNTSGSEASIGAILGPTITVFILIDVAAVGAVYYIMKRRMNARSQWRPSITRNEEERKGDNRTNNYVGIQASTEPDRGYIQAIGEEYEEVAQQRQTTSQETVQLPQRKKAWFNFGRNQERGPGDKNIQPAEEYEEVDQPGRRNKPAVPIAEKVKGRSCLEENPGRSNQPLLPEIKKKKPETPKTKPKPTPLPSTDVNWTPADEYEDVETTKPSPSGLRSESPVSKDPCEGMRQDRSALKPKFKRPEETRSKAPSNDEELKPTECYEPMTAMTPTAGRKLKQRSREPTIRQREQRKPISPGDSFKTTKGQGSPKIDRNVPARTPSGQRSTRCPPAVRPKPKLGQPTEIYDNAEVLAESETSRRKYSENRTEGKPIAAQRKRTVTEPSDPNQIYDNFERIMEVKQQTRRGSQRPK